MERRQWLVRWTDLDGYDDYEIVSATDDEVANIENRLQDAGYHVTRSLEVGAIVYSAEMFNLYLDELEVPR